MDFVGSGRRLEQGDVGEAARWLGVETAVLLSFMEIEAAGRGFDSKNRPKMLFEPHIFWRELGDTADRKVAAAAGIAYPKWGAAKYPSDSYPRLKAAMAIDETRALRSSSWGLGQIMGFNAGAAGHPTAMAMVRAAMQGEKEQLWAMVALMKGWGMVPMLTGKDFSQPDSWRQAASKWNGSGYAKHNYHGRMATAYIKHRKGEPMFTPDSGAAVLVRGMKGEAVRALQADLASLGYEFALGVDGRFGDETDANVRRFQRDNSIKIDGKVGPETRMAISAALADQEADLSPPPPVWPGQKPKPAPAPPPDRMESKSGAPTRDAGIAIAVGLLIAAVAVIAIWLLG